MERTGDFEPELEPDVHEEPEPYDQDPAHAEPGRHSGLTLWLGAALFLICVALFFYALGSQS